MMDEYLELEVAAASITVANQILAEGETTRAMADQYLAQAARLISMHNEHLTYE